jgi:hypothetical protein
MHSGPNMLSIELSKNIDFPSGIKNIRSKPDPDKRSTGFFFL